MSTRHNYFSVSCPTFHLPREHGVVVTFAVAGFICLAIHGGEPAVWLSETALWLLFLSLHRSGQLLTLTMLLALVVAGLNAALAVWIMLFGFSLSVVGRTGKAGLGWLREILGIGGATVSPLIADYCVSHDGPAFILLASALLAAAFTSTAFVHMSRFLAKSSPEAKMRSLSSAFLAAWCWVLTIWLSPQVALLALFPYAVQGVWLVNAAVVSMKRLGQLAFAAMIWMALVLVLHASGIV